LLPALVAYRAIYYLLPLTVAMVGLVADEVHQRRGQVMRLGATLGALTEQLMPRVLSIFTFLAGLVLLLSGATPAAPGRLSALARVIPLGVIEVSHFTGSVVGAALLVLSHGLARRLDAAYFLGVASMSIGIAASLLKGADYEEAAFLSLLLLVLWRARPAFDRRAAFFETRFSAGWIMAVVGAVSASIWLGLFAFKHVDYSHELWWQFESRAEASRFLRASVGAATRSCCSRWPGCSNRPRTKSSSPMRPTSTPRAPSSPRTVLQPPTSSTSATRRCCSTRTGRAS
jgi:phosphatidylglycerol lysyltransferase